MSHNGQNIPQSICKRLATPASMEIQTKKQSSTILMHNIDWLCRSDTRWQGHGPVN